MLISLIDAFKDCLRLSDEEIGEAIGISDSSIVKHRKDQQKEFSPKASGLIVNFVKRQVEDEFPTMSPAMRLYLWRKLVDVVNMLPPRTLNEMELRGIAKIISKKYIFDGVNIHPDWQ